MSESMAVWLFTVYTAKCALRLPVWNLLELVYDGSSWRMQGCRIATLHIDRRNRWRCSVVEGHWSLLGGFSQLVQSISQLLACDQFITGILWIPVMSSLSSHVCVLRIEKLKTVVQDY
jgi:hypothetical protein